jgi:hypothetical protein
LIQADFFISSKLIQGPKRGLVRILLFFRNKQEVLEITKKYHGLWPGMPNGTVYGGLPATKKPDYPRRSACFGRGALGEIARLALHCWVPSFGKGGTGRIFGRLQYEPTPQIPPHPPFAKGGTGLRRTTMAEYYLVIRKKMGRSMAARGRIDQ